MAQSFVHDMIATGMVVWNEQTEIISVVPMYDNTDSNMVTAYTINLTQGYIVISAFRDTYNLIPEWSDKSEPIYKSIDASDSKKVIYKGLYEYYIETDDNNAIGLGNVTVNKNQIVDNITPTRSLDCISDSVFVAASKNAESNTRSTEDYDPAIPDPETDAYNYTTGPFVIRQSVDYWGSNMPYYTTRYGRVVKGYDDCCGPTAFTNLVWAYKDRYSWAGNSLLRSYSDINTMFNDITEHGIIKGYYIPGSGTGYRSSYISELLNKYAMWSNYYYYPQGTGLSSYDALYAHLQDNRLIDIALINNNIYGNHEIICHGVTRFQSTSSNAYLSYIHIADGHGISTRYLTVASILTTESLSVEFLGV